QAEDGIRDRNVTGVQTCALPISFPQLPFPGSQSIPRPIPDLPVLFGTMIGVQRLGYESMTWFLTPPKSSQLRRLVSPTLVLRCRSEERRVGKEWRWRGAS